MQRGGDIRLDGAGKNHSRIIQAARQVWTGLQQLNDYVDAMNETHGQGQLVCADCDHSEVMLILSLPRYLCFFQPHSLSLFLSDADHGLSLLFLRAPQMV